MEREYRVLYCGGAGSFSRTVLEELLAWRVHIVARVVYGFGPPQSEDRQSIPVAQTHQSTLTESWAQDFGHPTHYVNALDKRQTVESLAQYLPDFILCACFPRILPKAIRSIPTVACVNLHPSMLPAYRGPTPIFWQLRYGERNTGVSLHLVTRVLDGGDVLLQRRSPFSDGLSNDEIGKKLGAVGAQLFLELLQICAAGRLESTRQDESRASYFPVPQAQNFTLCADWSARRAFNFVCGTNHWGVPYRIAVGERTIEIRSAMHYEASGLLEDPYQESGNRVAIQFTPGILYTVGA